MAPPPGAITLRRTPGRLGLKRGMQGHSCPQDLEILWARILRRCYFYKSHDIIIHVLSLQTAWFKSEHTNQYISCPLATMWLTWRILALILLSVCSLTQGPKGPIDCPREKLSQFFFVDSPLVPLQVSEALVWKLSFGHVWVLRLPRDGLVMLHTKFDVDRLNSLVVSSGVNLAQT